MSALNNSALIGASGSTGYQISRSVRLRSSASAYFSRTPGSAGNRKTFTISYWIKRGALTGTQYLFQAGSGTTEATWFQAGAFDTETTGAGTWTTTGGITTAVFRDPSAWYHIVVAVDTTQATAANRCKIYVNNVQQTTSTPTLTLNADLAWNNSGVVHYIGARVDSGPRMFFDGYLTEINSIDGQALTPSSFGETNPVTGVWQPKRYVGTYGTNGFYLNFSDPSAATAAAIGKDYSGNGNNWTPNNISVTAGATYDSMLDVPTPWPDGGNGRGNYCVMNPLAAQGNTVDNGNMRVTLAASIASTYGVRGTMSIRSGDKFYWEVTPTTASGIFTAIGIYDASYRFGADMGAVGSNCVLYYKSSGNKIVNGTTTAYGTTYAANDVIGIALDYSANTCTFYLNNVSQGSISLPSTSIEYIPVVGNENGVADVFQCNFGQRPFAYTPPSGFRALNTQNLPTPTIAKGNQYFDATLYTGNGTSQTVTNSGAMQPDFVWVKARSIANSNTLVNSAVGATSFLSSNSTNAEATNAQVVSAITSTGFSVGNDGNTNSNTNTYVGWQWKEGATQGFDIVTYTGTGSNTTIAHNLGVAPRMMIVKNRGASGTNWAVYHASLGASDTQYMLLNTAGAINQAGALALWNNTAPTSSVFSVGTQASTNASGNTYVAYLFAQIAGFSAFGSYTGNGSADGPFVFLGFRPAFVMVKRTDSTGNWTIHDDVRNGYNVSGAGQPVLYPNLSNAEQDFSPAFDLLSNGFKVRNSAADLNANGGTYVYACFAENPLKYALAR